MQDFNITKVGSTFHIEGFPDGIKVISIEGSRAEKLSDLWLHRFDLRSTIDCLEAINHTSENPRILREALWRTAIVFFFKCFSWSRSREKLLKEEVYEADRQFLSILKNLKDLRDRYLVHDENAYSQSFPGAILNRGNKTYKIEKVCCIAFLIETSTKENLNDLHLLTQRALKYVEEKLDKVCVSLTKDLEAKPYDVLFKMRSVKWTTPDPKKIGKPRKNK